jgi:hypothetical protein
MMSQGQADLSQIVGAGDPVRRFPHRLDGLDHQADQDAKDYDKNQQLAERKRPPPG